MSPRQRTICVLGMHRSGTSCLAGTLEQAGVFLGEVATANRFNAKGNRESAAVRALNQGLLHDHGADWNQPPPGPVAWSPARRAELAAIIAGYADRPVWGFKDPRVLLTLAGWREALPGLEFVGTVRHPLAVARSLHARPRGPALAEGVRLWAIYNAPLLALRREREFPIVSFDAPPERLAAHLREVTRGLGLDNGGSVAPDFFDPDLQHHGADPAANDGAEAALTAEARELHAQLLALAWR